MTVHLMKLAVGVESIDHLRRLQGLRARALGLDGRVASFTRRRPRRAEAVLDGGSLFWVIRGILCVRQKVVAFGEAADAEGRASCVLTLDAYLQPTVPVARRPFQGWRYLSPEDAPGDLPDSAGAEQGLPAGLAAMLDGLGVR